MIHQKTIIQNIKSFLENDNEGKKKINCFCCEFTDSYETCMICNDKFWSSQFEYPENEKVMTLPDEDTEYVIEDLKKKIKKIILKKN